MFPRSGSRLYALSSSWKCVVVALKVNTIKVPPATCPKPLTFWANLPKSDSEARVDSTYRRCQCSGRSPLLFLRSFCGPSSGPPPLPEADGCELQSAAPPPAPYALHVPVTGIRTVKLLPSQQRRARSPPGKTFKINVFYFDEEIVTLDIIESFIWKLKYVAKTNSIRWLAPYFWTHSTFRQPGLSPSNKDQLCLLFWSLNTNASGCMLRLAALLTQFKH